MPINLMHAICTKEDGGGTVRPTKFIRVYFRGVMSPSMDSMWML